MEFRICFVQTKNPHRILGESHYQAPCHDDQTWMDFLDRKSWNLNGKQEAISSVQNKAVTFQYTAWLIGIQNTIHHHNLSISFLARKKIRIKTQITILFFGHCSINDKQFFLQGCFTSLEHADKNGRFTHISIDSSLGDEMPVIFGPNDAILQGVPLTITSSLHLKTRVSLVIYGISLGFIG